MIVVLYCTTSFHDEDEGSWLDTDDDGRRGSGREQRGRGNGDQVGSCAGKDMGVVAGEVAVPARR
jgi:hypothetical protein